MAKITLVLGGARSGKSRLAQELALNLGGRHVTYLATAERNDAEMEKRIELHRKDRPSEWKTWEGTPERLPEALKDIKGVALLDCVTVWLSRLALARPAVEGDDEDAWLRAESAIRGLAADLLANARTLDHLILVSNEVGFSLVPPYRLGRRFRDLQGRVNQDMAARADAVALVVAGMPLWLKGSAPA
jgi:adenosylcobinamide kinase/adenosylcobinamide-phosphate guanylyltransferase